MVAPVLLQQRWRHRHGCASSPSNDGSLQIWFEERDDGKRTLIWVPSLLCKIGASFAYYVGQHFHYAQHILGLGSGMPRLLETVEETKENEEQEE
jgi:hypothetical protein